MTKEQARKMAEYAATRFNQTYHIAPIRNESWSYWTGGAVGAVETFQPDPDRVAKYEAYWGHRANPNDAGAQQERIARQSPANATI